MQSTTRPRTIRCLGFYARYRQARNEYLDDLHCLLEECGSISEGCRKVRVVLLRVGIDTGSGGIHSPLYQDGSFEYIPIPDGRGLDKRTYGNTAGKHGKTLGEYFPTSRQIAMATHPIHFDPEFSTYTYGDPTIPKRSLRYLGRGDILVFYAGLEGWDFASPPALYLIGYFEVAKAGIAAELNQTEVRMKFAENFHVRHESIYILQKSRLVLVKGGPGSRMFSKAARISSVGYDVAGREIKVLSPEMRELFGDFGGRVSIQRSPPRWVHDAYVERAANFVRSLE